MGFPKAPWVFHFNIAQSRENKPLYQLARGAHYLLNWFNLNFIHDFQSYKMANNNSIVQSVKFYKFGKNSLWLSIVHNNQWNRFSLDITRMFTYTKDGETKEGSSTIYFNLTTTKALVDQLALADQLAKNLLDNQNAKIYNKFCLFSEIFYTFQH